MGIYIKNMEMPPEGSTFLVIIHPDGTLTNLKGTELKATAIPADEEKEKTGRYDALQTAIKFTIEAYKHRREEADKNYRNDKKLGNIAAYNKGTADVYGCVITDLERWVK